MRQRGLERLQRRFGAGEIKGPGDQVLGGPASTTADWLAFITDPSRNIVPEQYQYRTPTYIEPDTELPVGYGRDPAWDFHLDPTMNPPPEGRREIVNPPPVVPVVNQAVNPPPVVPTSITPPSNIPLTPQQIEDLANRSSPLSYIPEPPYVGQTGANFDPTTGFPLDPTVSQSSTMFIEPTAGQSTTMFNQPPGTYNVAPPTTIPGVPGSNIPYSADWGLSPSQAFGASQVTLPNAYTQALYRIPGGAGYSVQAPGGSVPDPWQPIAWR